MQNWAWLCACPLIARVSVQRCEGLVVCKVGRGCVPALTLQVCLRTDVRVWLCAELGVAVCLPSHCMCVCAQMCEVRCKRALSNKVRLNQKPYFVFCQFFFVLALHQ